jgi:hypothetical protein
MWLSSLIPVLCHVSTKISVFVLLDAPALCGYLDDVTLHVDDLHVCGHRAARLTWCRRYLRFRIQDWANILFRDESRFHLDSSDGRSRVYRRVGERYADACVIQCQSFGGGSVMVWGGITAHSRTPLVIVAGNLTGIRYRDEIVQPYVIPFITAVNTRTAITAV